MIRIQGIPIVAARLRKARLFSGSVRETTQPVNQALRSLRARAPRSKPSRPAPQMKGAA
jgi:hypothetical protein